MVGNKDFLKILKKKIIKKFYPAKNNAGMWDLIFAPA